MSLATELGRLDTTYRRRQVVLQGATSLLISRAFSELTPEDIIEASPAVDAWLDRGVTLTTALRERSASDARDYYDSVRALVSPGAPPVTHPRVEPLDPTQVKTSLFVTGVVGARKRLEAVEPPAPTLDESVRTVEGALAFRQRQLDLLEQGRAADLEAAIPTSGQAAGAAAARHVANGGREQVEDTVKADRIAIGYIRIISAKACAFCAMLASRGPVYKADSFDDSDMRFTGDGRHKVHDNCSCSMRPIFSRSGAELPQLNAGLEQRWKALSDEVGGGLDLTTWRQHYEGRIAS